MAPSPSAQKQIAFALLQVDQFHAVGRLADAEAQCRQLLSFHPEAIGAHNMLAIILKDGGQFAEANAVMTGALAMAPREATLHNNLGNILRAQNDFSAAEQAYRRAIALKPDYAEAFHNLGTVLQENGEDLQALASFRRALALRPAYLPPRIEAGMQLSKRGENAQALAMLRPAAAANPNYFPARYYIGHVLSALGRFDEAVVELEAAFRLNPKSPEAALALGNTYNALARDEMALRAYATAIDLWPECLEAHFAYNQLAWMMGRQDGAASYAAARAAVGDKPDLLLAESNQRLRQEDVEGARQLLERARRVAPQRADLTHALGRVMTLEKRFDEASNLLNLAVAANSENVLYRRELGIALLRAGQARDACQALEGALARAPFDQLTLAYLSLAFRELGDGRFDNLVNMEKSVRVYDLPPPPGFANTAAFNLALGDELLAQHGSRPNGPFDQTVRGGSQTVGHLFATGGARVGQLRERIEDAVRDYISAMPDQQGHPLFGRKAADFFFSGAWSCRLKSSGYHANHVHHEGWISSAYYVSLPDAVEDATSRQGWLVLGESWLGLSERDRPARVEKPVVGKLVLFPSYYWHGTTPFTSSVDRLSVAFDVVPGTPRR